MEKKLSILVLALLSLNLAWSQCVPSCSNYIVSPITFTTFPTAGNNAIPMFAPNADDGYTPPVQLGFNFNFYCTTYSTVLIYTNGLLQFDIGVPSTFPFGYDAAQLLPNPSLPTVLNGIVCFKMDDFDASVGGSVTYTTIGVSPNMKFILTYSNVPIYGLPTLLNSGQIVLYQTTNIIEIYTIAAPVSPNLATQGIENALGTLAATSPNRNQTNWSGTNDAYQFAPYAPAPPTAINGNTVLCQGTQSTYSINASAGASSYSWTLPIGWNGSSTTTAITGTAGAAGTVSVTATYTCGISAATTLSINAMQAPVITIQSLNPQGVVCSGNDFTITPAGGLTYTLSPGGVVSNSVFVFNAGNINSFTIAGADANCPALSVITTSIQINASPTIAVNSGTICELQTFSIIPTGTGADGYIVTGGFLIVTPPVGVHSYTVTGTNSTNQCSSVPVVSNLTVNPNPSLIVTSAQSIICNGETDKLTASGAATYLWNVGGTTSNITITPSITAQYTVTGTSAEGCSIAKTINLIVTQCTGIEQLNFQSQAALVYPNPSNGTFNVLLINTNQNTGIEIYDAIGRLVLSQKTDLADNNLNLTNQPNGLYYIKIKNSETQQTLKIIKE